MSRMHLSPAERIVIEVLVRTFAGRIRPGSGAATRTRVPAAAVLPKGHQLAPDHGRTAQKRSKTAD